MDLNHNDIKLRELLNKYWEGETSLDEERDLKEFFIYGMVPDDLEDDAAYFRATMTFEEDELGDDFDEAVLNEIRGGSEGRLVRMSFIQQYWRQVAAAVIILSTGLWFIWGDGFSGQDDKIYTADGQVDDEEVRAAFKETKKALFMLSNGMNRGQEQAVKISKFNDATEQVKNIDNE